MLNWLHVRDEVVCFSAAFLKQEKQKHPTVDTIFKIRQLMVQQSETFCL